jgi:hypothetical protein
LSAWQNFYVIVGSSGGALIGLQFVADLPLKRGDARSADAFGTPTVVHFGSVLLLSAILSAPWGGAAAPTLLCGLCGLTGFVYVIVVLRRAREQSAYKPVFEDWLFHVLLPAAAYGLLAAAAYAAHSHVHAALFGVATAALLLLFIGIHNAWDSVTFLVFERGREQDKDLQRRG